MFNYKKNSILFDIEHYLLSLFYYDVNESDLFLKTYLNFFEPKNSINKDFQGKTIALCLLFAEKFKSFRYFKDFSFLRGVVSREELNKKVNIIQIFEYFNNKYKNKFYLKENNDIYNQNIKNEDTFIKPSLMTSIILLKRALPYILYYIKEKYEIDKIKLYDFNNNLVDYDSLDDIYKNENEDYEDDVINDDENEQQLEFINNYFKLLNYALDEIVASANINNFVYDF